MSNVLQFDPKKTKAKKKAQKRSQRKVLVAIENLLAAAMQLIEEVER